jgi:hypothetical protein
MERLYFQEKLNQNVFPINKLEQGKNSSLIGQKYK